MRKFKLIVSALLASTMGVVAVSGLTACGDNEQKESVSSVSITNKSSVKSLKVGDNVALSINVNASSADAKGFEVVSSDATVVKIVKSGNNFKVNALKEGSATITVTSTYDKTKSDSVDIVVVEAGFDPSWIDEGFTFSKSFPTSELKKFLGSGSYVVPEFAKLDGGSYYLNYPEDDEYYAQFIIIVDGIRVDEYADLCAKAGFDRIISSSEGGYEIIDPTLTFDVIVSFSYDEETYKETAPTILTFYKCSDVWGSSKKTTDTAWSEKKIKDAIEYCSAPELARAVAAVPFVALGEDYEISSYIEDYGFFQMPIPNSVMICDYSLDDKMLDGYESVLTAAGYVKETAEDGYVTFEKDLDAYLHMSLAYGWDATGNTIYGFISAVELANYPSTEISDFVSDDVESFYDIPDFAGTAKSYGFMITPMYEFDENYKVVGEYNEATVNVNGSKEADFNAYVQLLKDNGFETEIDKKNYEDYGEIDATATKGRIYIDLVYYAEEVDYYEYSKTDGDIEMKISADDSVDEPKIYFDDESVMLVAEDALTVTATARVPGTVTYASSNTEVVTVDETSGALTGVAKGTAVITATLKVSDSVSYKTTINVSVVDKATGINVTGPATVGKNKVVNFGYEATPAGSKAVGEAVFSITEGSEFGTITPAGVFTAGDVDEERSVTIKCQVGELSATKVVTVKPVVDVVDTITLAKLGLSNIGTVYTNFSGKKDVSEAAYTGRCAGKDDTIQLRTKKDGGCSGIVSATSGGALASVTVAFNSQTTGTKGVQIYASDKAFTVDDMFSGLMTPVKQITASDTNKTFEFSGDFAYIGIRSIDGACYLDSFSVTWQA